MKPPFKLNPVIGGGLPFDPQRGAAELEAAHASGARGDFVGHAIATTTREDVAYINQIIARVAALAVQHKLPIASTLQLGLDLCLAHARQPLNLWALLAGGDDDLTHDVLGIGRNIDRLTGELGNGFKPRNLKVPS